MRKKYIKLEFFIFFATININHKANQKNIFDFTHGIYVNSGEENTIMNKFRNPMVRPVRFKNPTGNVMKEIKEADLNNFSAGAGEPRVSNGTVVCTITDECNMGTLQFFCGC